MFLLSGFRVSGFRDCITTHQQCCLLLSDITKEHIQKILDTGGVKCHVFGFYAFIEPKHWLMSTLQS
jgi:hypothetical protein